MRIRGYLRVEQEYITGHEVVTNVAVEDFDLVDSGAGVLTYKLFEEAYDIVLSIEVDGYRIARYECHVDGKNLEQAGCRAVRITGGHLWLE